MHSEKKFDLEEEHIEEIKGLLNWRLSKVKDRTVKVYAFGSRTNGKTRKTSDIDLALDADGQKLPFLFIEGLKEILL